MNKLLVVGLGPGAKEFMTTEAQTALAQAELICGYSVYTDLVSPLYPQTPLYSTPMMQETDRCRVALEKASQGVTVALVCSGDAGVYGMASLVLELAPHYPTVDIEIVAGVTAALSGGAVLGAPLAHDFAVLSLSDLLTPWETIEKRLHAAGMGDFCIALYNPASKKRSEYLGRACDILLHHKPPETVCGWVRNIGRQGQQSLVLTLEQLRREELDMFCTVFIGNAETKVVEGKMVTPRGYHQKGVL